MARPDGRIEPGQPLRGAISARAWNRTQDAADIVLGDRYAITAGESRSHFGRLVVAVKINVPSGLSGIPPGLAVLINDAYPKTLLSDGSGSTPHSGGLLVSGCSGDLTTLSAYDPLDTGAIGVTIDGSQSNASGEVVLPVAISGVAVARVRKFSDSHRFAVSPVRRISEQTAPQHRGLLDSHPCACDTSVRVISYGPQASSFTDATAAPIVWAVVLL